MNTVKLLIITTQPAQMRARLSIGIQVEPDSSLAVKVRADSIDLLGIPIAQRHKLEQV